ncbi:MAG: DUF3382 domain-containing protein, partial [Magnetospirillum sp.]|nr:DUF3382 domain-containing protein [Magnetospirillum sp.]
MAGVNLQSAAKDGILGAVVAAALALPMLGFRLVDSASALTLATRFDWVLWAAAIVGLGRFAVSILRQAIPAERVPAMPDWGARFPKARLVVGWAMAGFALALPFLPFADRSLVDKATLVLI